VTPSPASRLPFLRTLPGRLFILSSILLVILFVWAFAAPLPPFLHVFRTVARLAWIVSAVWLLTTAVALHRHRFLWRVRQKLILSYVFLGFVPVLLVVALTLMGGFVLYINLAAYMFHEGFDDIRSSVAQVTETAANELGRNPAVAVESMKRRYENLATRYPALSLAVVPVAPGNGAPITSGPWRHMRSPTDVPPWVASSAVGFRGVIAVPVPTSPGEWMLVIRAVVPTRDQKSVIVADLPVDASIGAEVEARSETRMGRISVPEVCGGPPAGTDDVPVSSSFAFFKRSTAFLDCTNWDDGSTGKVTVSLEAPASRLYARLDQLRTTGVAPYLVFIVLGVLFLIIQGSALVMGALLARSITYAVHELFQGTERVQQGDFAHRIRIESGDQLGDLANSFNRMSSSIEHLLHVQREKQRLDDELRIARDIQKSLLPASPPIVEGLGIADLCEPAREVGGDYYDFFDLGRRRLGVMVADVSGKGTSAALYMAELKGLMLALTRKEQSPRSLLIEANSMLSAHLDNRSFITMTYAVIDLEARTLTCARAGHTPLIVVSNGCSEVIAPSGMVLGLRLPGAAELFGEVLEDYTRPLQTGDVIVLYTDGITEAMNDQGDLFSDESLATVVQGQHEHDAAEIRERVVREVRAFVGDAEPHDDMTMIVLKMEGPQPS
jgi:sigma-B regulation protein RsbU (phosphoserine phosphatase)